MTEATFTERDRIFLAYAEKKCFRFDIENGKIFNGKGVELGSRGKSACTISWYMDGVGHGVTRGRALWLHAKGPVPQGFEVGHRSNDRHDDCLSNLELSTISARSIKAVQVHGWKLISRTKTHCKLTVALVNEARVLARDPESDYGILAKKFGVSRPTIIDAIKGATWMDATEEPAVIRKGKGRKPGPKKPKVIRERKVKVAVEKPQKVKKVAVPKPVKIVVKPHEEARRIVVSLLKNNAKISDNGIMMFLRLRRVDTGFSEKRLTKIRQELRIS